MDGFLEWRRYSINRKILSLLFVGSVPEIHVQRQMVRLFSASEPQSGNETLQHLSDGLGAKLPAFGDVIVHVDFTELVGFQVVCVLCFHATA